ncbi:hypothetical protein HK097_011570 [Rhizophlyctis rosea]|uniref:Uncharacterized protein n=1 Tax=Rhizophlyctis rosea TaxID=64517 RepID=A0AAD5SI53_9FUNG|nr:hypothetical protein HK097_011570 [Rhizophlyctis rosea]
MHVRQDDPNATPANLLHLFRVTQAAMELKNMYLEEAEEQIQSLDASLKESEAEINRQRAAALGGDSYGAEMRSLREDIAELERRNEDLTKDVVNVEAALESERITNQELSLAIGKEKSKVVALEDDVKRLKGEVSHYVAQLNSQKDRLQSKHTDEDQFRNQLKEKNNEISRYVAEVQILGTENAQLHDEIDAMAQELEATVLEIERTSKEHEEAQEIIIKNDRMIDRLTEERDAIKQKLGDLSTQLASGGSKDEKLIEEMHKEIRKQKNVNRDFQRQALEKDTQIQRLLEDLETLKEEIRYFNIDAMKKLISEKDEKIQALNDKLQEAYHDFELLSIDWDQLDKSLKSQHNPEVDNTRAHVAAVGKLKEKIDAYKSRHKDDLSKLRSVDGQLENKEKELMDLRERMERYERGQYGLQEAVREIKDERLQRKMREKDILASTEKTNDLQAQRDELLEENEELRRRLGIESSMKIDLTHLRSERARELEKTRSLNMELQREVERLEEERLQFKKAMRLHALERGGRAAELGLTAAQLAEMEDYAEFLRSRSSAKRVPGGSPTESIGNSQLTKLALELERAQVNAEESRLLASGAQSQMEKITKENAALEAAIKEVSATLVRLMENGGTSGKTMPISLPMVEKLIELIEEQRKMEQGEQLQKSGVTKDIIGLTQVLRKELQEVRQISDALGQKLQDKQQEVEGLKHEREQWKERALVPRQRILNLPAELSLGNMQDYSALVEQLVESLLDQQRLNGELAESKKQLCEYANNYGLLAQKQTLLYQDLTSAQKAHSVQLSDIQKQLQSAIAEKEDAQVQVKELKVIAESIAMGPEDVKKNLVETQRRLIVLLANEKTLTRRYLAMVDVEEGLRKEGERLKADVSQLDRSAKETIGRLQRAKSAAYKEVELLQRQLSESVSVVEHNKLEAHLQLLQTKTRNLLERQTQWIVVRDELADANRRNTELSLNLERMEMELMEAKGTAVRLDATLSRIGKDGDGGGSSAQRIIEAEQKAASVEVKLEVAQHRVERAEKKAADLAQVEVDLKKRLEALDAMYLEAQDENLRLREVELSVQYGLEGHLSKEEYQRNKQLAAQLEKEVDRLKDEVAKYKNLSDIAMAQTADMTNRQAADAKEKNILRAAVRELQMEGQDKLVIGKLHHHILALQISETAALKKLEAVTAKCTKLEGTILQLEKAADENQRMIFQMRMDHKKRSRYLQQTVSDLRIQLSGAVKLEKHERTCDMLRKLNAEKIHHKAETDKTLDIKFLVASDKTAQLELQNQLHEQLITSLRNESTSNQRMVAWHAKLSDLQLANLRLERQITREVSGRLSAEREFKIGSESVAGLEEKLAAIQSDLEARQLEWELRQNDLEATVQKYEGERDKIFMSATAAELKQVLPDQSLPIGQQLESAIRLCIERSRIATAQEVTITNLEGKMAVLQQQLEERSEKLLQSNRNVTTLRLEVTKQDFGRREEAQVQAGAINARTRKREDQTIRTAQESMKSLQTQLAQKDLLVEKYQAMVREVRDEMFKQKEAHRAELANKISLLNRLNDREITHISKLPQERSNPGEEMLGAVRPEELERLEKVMAAKDAETISIKGRLQQLTKELDAERNARKDENDRFLQLVEGKAAELEEQTRIVEALSGEVEGLQRKIDEQPAELLDTISNLKHLLEQKTAKHAASLKVIQKLRSSIQQAAEEAQKKTRVDPERYEMQRLVEARTASLTSKVLQLEAKIQRMSKQVEEHRHDEAELEGDLKKLSAELHKRDETVSKQSDMLDQAQKHIHSLESKMRRLREERDEFKRTMEDMALSRAKESAGESDAEGKRSSKCRRVKSQSGSGSDSDAMVSGVAAPPSCSAQEVALVPVAKHEEEALTSQHLPSAVQHRKSAETWSQPSVSKWELEKRFNRKIANLKTELAQKNQECESSKRLLLSLKETVTRSEHDRLRLQQKVKTLSLQLATAMVSGQSAQQRKGTMAGSTLSMRRSASFAVEAGPNDSRNDDETDLVKSQADTIIALQSRIHTLEMDVFEQKRRTEIEAPNEIIMAQHEAKQLKERLKVLEELNDQLRRSKGVFSRSEGEGSGERDATGSVDTSARVGDKTKGLVGVLESRVRDLLNKYQALETEKVQKDAEILAIKFAKEQADMGGQRLLRKVTELEDYIRTVKESQAPAPTAAFAIPSLPIPLSTLLTARTTLSNRPTSDLLAVIEHLSKGMEKLRSEVDALKRGRKKVNDVPSQAKYMEMAKEVKRLRKERDEMEMERKGVQDCSKKVAKVEEENTKLRRALRTAQDAQAKASGKTRELEIARDQLVEELANVKRSVAGISAMGLDEAEEADERVRSENLLERVKDLKRELAEKDAVLQKMLNPDKDVTNGMANEVRRLNRELEMWRARATKLTEQVAASSMPSRAAGSAESGYSELEKENQQLKEQLSKFTPSLLEELEDLRHNYRDCVELNVRYEAAVTALCGRLGVPIADVLKQAGIHV